MNAITLFALLLCAIVVMVSGSPMPLADDDIAPMPAAPVAAASEDLLEGAESRGYGYGGRHNYGGYRRRGGDYYRHRHG